MLAITLTGESDINMASNFKFVPRSVNHKPSKTKQISRVKPQNLQNVSTEVRGTSLAISEGNRNDTKGENSTQSGEKYKQEIDSDDDGSDIVYFSKNQRWPEDDDPVCVVCGRYGEYICDQTEADVCSKECKARNLHLKKASKKQQGEEFDSADKTSQTERRNCQTAAETNREPIPNSHLNTPQENTPYKYTVHPKIALLTEEQVYDLRSSLGICIRGENIERPILEFDQCGLSEQLYNNLKKSGYKTPTPVQMQVIPVALAGNDLLSCAQTGSGKTAAFLVPMITRIQYNVGT